uniref:YccV-like domain-containing protein n=1 Tax=Caenorhabditis japonica TaxID=281687 RepID=A0A8R1I3Z3_CAEJA
MDIRPEYIFIGIMILVPAQFLLSPSETGHLKYHLNSLIYTFKQYIPLWLSGSDENTEATEAITLDTETNPEGNGAYGMGQYTRQRAPNVEFRVGDVIYHENLNFRGVIIGWDEKTVAPAEFIKVAHGENKHYADQPNYAVLMDTRDRLTPQLTYVPQENIQRDKGTVIHPLISKFFDSFDENRQRYLMRPVYKMWYPDD